MQEWSLREGTCLQDLNDKRIKTCLQRFDTLAFTSAIPASCYADDMCGAADNSSADDEESDSRCQSFVDIRHYSNH